MKNEKNASSIQLAYHQLRESRMEHWNSRWHFLKRKTIPIQRFEKVRNRTS
jgi:hypothetical protein